VTNNGTFLQQLAQISGKTMPCIGDLSWVEGWARWRHTQRRPTEYRGSPSNWGTTSRRWSWSCSHVHCGRL